MQYQTPEGSLISWEEADTAAATAPDRDAYMAALVAVPYGVPGSAAPVVVGSLVVINGAAALLLLAGAVPVVDRRRIA